MTETTESVRKDSSARQLEEKEIVDWSGKRFVPPRGTTLPSNPRESELFVKIVGGGRDKLLMYDAGIGSFQTVGP